MGDRKRGGHSYGHQLVTMTQRCGIPACITRHGTSSKVKRELQIIGFIYTTTKLQICGAVQDHFLSGEETLWLQPSIDIYKLWHDLFISQVFYLSWDAHPVFSRCFSRRIQIRKQRISEIKLLLFEVLKIKVNNKAQV